MSITATAVTTNALVLIYCPFGHNPWSVHVYMLAQEFSILLESILDCLRFWSFWADAFFSLVSLMWLWFELTLHLYSLWAACMACRASSWIWNTNMMAPSCTVMVYDLLSWSMLTIIKWKISVVSFFQGTSGTSCPSCWLVGCLQLLFDYYRHVWQFVRSLWNLPYSPGQYMVCLVMCRHFHKQRWLTCSCLRNLVSGLWQ